MRARASDSQPASQLTSTLMPPISSSSSAAASSSAKLNSCSAQTSVIKLHADGLAELFNFQERAGKIKQDLVIIIIIVVVPVGPQALLEYVMLPRHAQICLVRLVLSE